MTNTNFRLLLNTFESQTRKSHTKAVKLSTDTTDKLRAATDPALVSVFTDYEPHHEAYLSLNVAISIAEGTYKGKTTTFEGILDTLPDKLRQWEPPVYALFPEDSGTAQEIFPRKRTPFYEGPYYNRLIAVEALRDNLLNYTVANPTLVPVQADVAAFYTLAKTARQTQQSREGGLEVLRQQRDQQRIVTMDAYWGIVYGGLLRKYYTQPDLLLGYIDLYELFDNQPAEPIVVNGSINPGQILNINSEIDGLEPAPESIIRMRNTSTTGAALFFYSAFNPGDGPGNGIQFTVNAGDTLEKTISDFRFDTYPNFNIHNPTGNNGNWEIEIII